MANHRYRIGLFGVATLVALRVVIGWHYFTAGLDKVGPEFSSAGVLRSANGPLADFYKSFAPLPHDWDVLIVEPLPPAEEFASERTADGYVPFPTEAYGPWASRIAEDWTATVDRFKSISDISEEQKQQADKVLEEQLARLAQYFEERRGDLADYHHELGRLNEMVESEARGELPYLDERILKKKAEVQAIPRPWVADIQAEETLLHDKLFALVSDEQRKSAVVAQQLPEAFSPSTQLDIIDTVVMLLTLIVGGCLIAGLFTRVAAIVGAAFLLSVMSMNPPWAEGVLETAKLLTAYQAIEFVGLLVLAGTGAGTWAGFDGLIWRRKPEE